MSYVALKTPPYWLISFYYCELCLDVIERACKTKVPPRTGFLPAYSGIITIGSTLSTIYARCVTYTNDPPLTWGPDHVLRYYETHLRTSNRYYGTCSNSHDTWNQN